MKCPACPAQLQPLPLGSEYVATAVRHAEALDVAMPAHGPAILVWAALVSHQMTVHDDMDLREYLEAYLGN